MPRILIVEDEPDIAMGLERDLSLHGYEVETVGDGASAIGRGKDPQLDLILLDIMLPRKDGFEVCRELRSRGVSTPIIMLTAKSHETDRVLGLELGADDYVTKPFSPRELRARVKAVLRRTEAPAMEAYRFGNCEVDFARARLTKDSKPVETSALEFRLLSAFIRSQGRVLTREYLIESVWGPDKFISPRVVDTHIVSLRKKIEPIPARPRFLISLRGIGYRFDG